MCQESTGQCVVRSCLTDGCPAGTYCDPAKLECIDRAPGARRRYVGETLVGHGVQSHLQTRDAVGLAALGTFTRLTVTRDGRYIYAVGPQVVRVDQATLRVETIAGIGWPGFADGPAEQAQFDVDWYQAGGIGLSPDERYLYFKANGRIRRLDLQARTVDTLRPPELVDVGLRGLAVGQSGLLYVNGWGTDYFILDPETGAVVEAPALDISQAWGVEGQPPGYLAVDEARGFVYGLERNRKSGALYRWPVHGGVVEWLNHEATGSRTPAQYLSDGPVSRLEMANPAGLTADSDGYLYIGAGDGRTFRRYDPDAQIVESLCAVPEAGAADTFEWCIGDGERNQLFNTWPSFLAFDAAGNGYFGYSVWPRLVRLRRVQ
ncbi:MAG: hypothetical protein D6729_00705 [Deltaproteobacteria bacterium]|nr:MAG: hypothetical protein D6729_00705 [Deltaproteobacteria bacterium]